jgi:hypothetical protein
MPLKSQAQWKACFASKGFGGRVDCGERAKIYKGYKDHTKKIKKKKNKKKYKGIN